MKDTSSASSNRTPLDLVGEVVEARVSKIVKEAGGSRVVFAIVDLGAELTTAIGNAIATSPMLESKKVDVAIHPDLATRDLIPELKSSIVATRFRNYAANGVVVTVFSVPPGDFEGVHQSLGSVTKIDESWLCALDKVDTWASRTLPKHPTQTAEPLKRILEGLIDSDILASARMMADFCAEIRAAMGLKKGMTLVEAVNHALPHLQLPRNYILNEKLGSLAKNAAQRFRQMRERFQCEFYLMLSDDQLRSQREMLDKIDALHAEEILDDDAAEAISALVNDAGITAGSWRESQKKVAEFSWQKVEPFFGTTTKRQKNGLGQLTVAYFDNEWPSTLTCEERDLLETIKRETDEASPEHSEFYNRHREKLQEDAQLFKRWRRFIFSKSIEENDDLVAGLVELAGKAFDNVQDVNDPILLVILRNAEKKSFWTTEKNTALCLYLRDRYRGLDAVLAPCAELDFGRCWSENWASEIKKPNTRGSTSEEFEFEAYVVSRQALANAKRNHKLLSGANKAQLKWKPGQTTFASAMSDDLGRVHTEGGDALLLRATATAARSTRGGTTERPTVTSVASITDSLGGSEGALANPDDDNSTNGWNRIDLLWRDKLEKHAAATLLKPTTKEKLLRAFQQFHQHYTAAIRSMATFGGAGLGSEALLDQANSYGQLLTVLRKHARAQELMSDLWEPLLQIGTAVVEGDSPAMIVTPWHPLKLLEMTAKAHQARDVIATISAPSTGHLAALDDFVRERLRSLRQSYYADVSLIREADNVRILVESESSSGYALLQPGFFEAGSELSDRPAKPTAAKFSEIASQYLLQMPHERANFSAVLLDAESEDLAVEITKNLAKQIENQQDLRCDLTVTHENPHKLRRIYERQNRRIGHEIELSLTSEAARNFLSRLRVGIAGLESLGGDDLTKSQDIVMLHDVIARKAKLTWHDAPFATICEQTLQHVPTDVSRRKSQSQGDVTSSVYLTSPSQIAPSQAFLDAIHDATQGKPTDVMQHFIPAQEVDIRSPAISEKLDSAHRLANWVITFDRIADRRLIARTSDNVRILRYFSSPRSVHNVIVSTEFSRDFLRSRLQADIEQVLPDLEEEKLDMLIETIRLRSAKLSGEIVMRGTHWDNYAQELIGIVVTQRELELLLGPKEENCVAMFFLDEFKEWLSLSGEVADILAVAFSVTPEGKPQLRLIVSEAKFINQEALFDSRKKSWSQLENTYEQIVSRFACPSVSIGSNIWRAHLAALLLEHMDPWPEQKTIAGMTFDDWVTYIRCGPELAVEVSGHSVICVHDLPSSEYDLSLKVADADQIGTERRRLAQWTLGSDRIKRSIGRLAEVRAEPLLIEPKEWANAPSFVVEGKKGSRQFGAPVTDGDGNAPLSSPQNGLQDGESDQASRRLEAQAESTDDSIDGTLNNSKDQQGDAQASVRDAGLVSNEPIGGAPHESTDGSPLVGDREEPASSIDSGKFVDVPAGWDAQVYATLREMLRNEEGEQGQEWLEEQVTRFQQSIQAEGKAAPVISARLTPNSGLVYVNARDITVRWLERNKVDLMTRYGVEIVRVTGLPGQIAVALKRPKRAILHLADAWLSRKLESGAPRNNTALVIGEKEDDGNLLYLSLERGFEGYERAAPHTIISGTTGSGKGILVSNLILDICAFNDPHAIEIHLIDPKKGADYLWAKDLPHLRGGIIHDKGAAVECLDSLVNDMDRRYALITEAGHPNIDQYNRHHSSEARIPRTIIFFDEVANWMLDDGFKKEVERLIDQVATKSRAAGLHLFMIYQRADNKVMTMQLRTNLGNKLVLRLGDEGSSKIALGERGAERLLGKGHVIAKLDSDEKIYAQVPFIQSDEASRLAEAIARAWK